MAIITLTLGIGIVALFGNTKCGHLFYPLHTMRFQGLEIEYYYAFQLDWPSTEHSCIILCALTPNCMWSRFISTNRSCFLSYGECPVFSINLGTSVTAVLHNMVSSQNRIFHTLKMNQRFVHNTINLRKTWLGEYRADSRLASNQWETSLQSNIVSNWLGANLESALEYHSISMPHPNLFFFICVVYY